MSKSPTPVDDPVTTGSQHSTAHETALRESDPELANEIYGTAAEKSAGTVTTGQPTPAGAEPPADPPAAAAPPAEPPAAAAAPAEPATPATPPAEPPATPAGSAATPMVPLARLNEVLGRLDEATRQLEASRAGGAPAASTATPAEPAASTPPAFDLAAKLREKLQAQWDGNEDRVVELELEIEAHRQAQANAAALAAVQADRAQTTLTTTLAQVGEQIVTEYPALDNRKEGHNPDAIAAFKAERDVQIAAGKSPDVAMRRAAALVAIDYGLQKVTTPPPAPTPTPPAGGGVDPITARQVDVARIAAQTANTPPNNVGGRGQGDLAPETKAYSREEWAQLDQRQKNEALGIA